MEKLNFISVVCLVLRDASGAVLATRRPPQKHLGCMWEFPGGKVESGERSKNALRREIFEELCISLGKLYPLTPVEHTYPESRVRLIPYFSYQKERPRLILREHAEAKWIMPVDFEVLEWAPADIPIMREVQQRCMV